MTGNHLLLIFLFLLILSSECRAEDSIPLKSKENFIPQNGFRIPGENRISELMNDKEYHYGNEYRVPENQGLFARLSKWISSILRLGLNTVSYLPLVLKIFIICILLVFLYVIATRTKLYKVFYSANEPVQIRFHEEDPLNDEFDIEKAISIEISEGKFRNAIRLLHLKLLYLLNNRNCITLSGEKTNRDYSREIVDPAIRNRFINLTSVYNRIWYGKYEPDKNEFETLLPDFLVFTNIVNGKKE